MKTYAFIYFVVLLGLLAVAGLLNVSGHYFAAWGAILAAVVMLYCDRYLPRDSD